MSTIDELMKNFNKTWKENLVQVGLTEYNYERIPFTSPRLNYMTFGGLPVGKLIEFYGEEHGGKTTTALDSVANFQNVERTKDKPRRVLYADCENTFDVEWATKLGVNCEEIIMLKPTSQGAEDLFQFILDMIDTGEIGLVVIDSLGVMVSNQAMDKTVAEKTYGGIAMALTNFSKKAEGLCQRHKTTLIGINQMRDDMNSMYGGTTTTGGKAWKHNCSVRLEFKRGKFIDDNNKELTRSAETPSGNIVMVSMSKNKTCPPTRRTGFYTLRYDIGIDYLNDLIEVAIKYGIVNKRGAWFDIVDIETGEILEGNLQGQANVYKLLSDDANVELLAKVEELIDNKIQEN